MLWPLPGDMTKISDPYILQQLAAWYSLGTRVPCIPDKLQQGPRIFACCKMTRLLLALSCQTREKPWSGALLLIVRAKSSV